MNDSEKLLVELKEIREIMIKSNRFLTLSGLSGILIGFYALIGAFIAWKLVFFDFHLNHDERHVNDIIILLSIIAASVLLLSLLTVIFLTTRKAKAERKPVWGPGSKLLLMNLSIPLVSGGFLIIILTFRGIFEIICPAFLIFYGLALVNAAKYTRSEILTLGVLQIILGLIAALIPGSGIYLWAAGFGLLHIIYGFLYLSQEKKHKIRQT